MLNPLSAYARQFLGQLDKPDVEAIEGLESSVSIDQNPPPIILSLYRWHGDEIYDYLHWAGVGNRIVRYAIARRQ